MEPLSSWIDINQTLKGLTQRLQTENGFYFAISRCLVHPGSVFIVLWCYFLLNSTCDNLIIQIRSSVGIMGKLDEIIPCCRNLPFTLSHSLRLCPALSSYSIFLRIKSAERTVKGTLVYFWRTCHCLSRPLEWLMVFRAGSFTRVYTPAPLAHHTTLH